MQHFRRRAGIIVCAVAVGLVAACGAPATPAVPPPPDSVGTRVDHAVPSSILRLPLTDQTGHATSLAAFHGKVLVISDMMTLCQETCPLDTANLVATARAVQRAGLGGQVEFASVTVDPGRDTPARLTAYRLLFDPQPANWTLLTGPPTSTAALWKYLGVYYQRVAETSPPAIDWLTGRPLTYDVDHADLIFFLDGDGHVRFTLDGAGHVEPGTPLPPRLRAFLDAQGRQNLTAPDGETWTVPQALQVVSWLTNHTVHA